MVLSDLTLRLLGLAETIHRWAGALVALDAGRREKVARYADEIAATLARAAEALTSLEADPRDKNAARRAVRELGRITGYVETIVGVLRHHLDGRKLVGVKRRLEQLGLPQSAADMTPSPGRMRIDRILAAEGYFRALADAMRA